MSAQRAIIVLLAWLVGTLVIGSAYLVFSVWTDERDKVEQQLKGWSSGIGHAVDMKLRHGHSQLEAIAALPAVAQGNWGEVYRFARRVFSDHPGTLVALVRADGQLLVNTLLPSGAELPNLWRLEDQESEVNWKGRTLPVSPQGLTREVFRSGRAGYSALYFDVNDKRPRIALAIPVELGGATPYALMISFRADDFGKMLNNAGLPAYASAALLDRNGTVIAGNGASPYAVAQKPELPARDGVLRHFVESDGTPTAAAYAMTSAGFTVMVGVPQAIAHRTARQAVVGWALVGAVALVLAMWAAARVNRRIAQPLRQLAASALGEGPGLTRPSYIHEIDLLAAALRAAERSDELRRQEHIRLIEVETKEEAVEASEAQLRRVFAGIYVSVAVLDPGGRLIELNHAFTQRPDINRDDVLGRLFWDCGWWNYDPLVQRTVRASVAEARESGEPVRYNVPGRLEDGRLTIVDLQLSPLKDEDDVVTQLIACAVDVQDRVDAIRSLQMQGAQAREIARKLDEQRWLLDAALEATPAGIVVSDRTGRLLRMNRANQSLWGAAPSSDSVDEFATWKGWWAQGRERQGEIVQPHEWPLARALQRARHESAVVEIEPFDAPGVRKTVQVNAAPVLDENGSVVGGVVVQMDITDRVRAEAALREADRHKDEFLAILGHELRNPLSPIRSAIHILRKHPTADPLRLRALAAIERQTKHMTRLVDDLLDIARITQGTIRMEREVANLQDIAAAAADAVAAAADAKGVRLRQEFAQEPLFVQGDATRLSQALINLLTNACKFTNAGGQIILRLRSQDASAIIEVADDGIGLAPGSVERIFGLFVQEQPSGAAGNSGLGIGLALSRNLLALHGGQLEAASAGLGKGSTFTARLPLVDAPAPTPVPVPAIPSIAAQQDCPSPRHRLLIVDDNRDACDLMRELLELSGFDASSAYDGATALKAVQGINPDALVLDIGLPDMDGYDLCRRIRTHAGTAPVIVALTGWGQAQDKKAAEDAGFDGHITKPADPDVLCDTLTTLLNTRQAAVDRAHPDRSLMIKTVGFNRQFAAIDGDLAQADARQPTIPH